MFLHQPPNNFPDVMALSDGKFESFRSWFYTNPHLFAIFELWLSQIKSTEILINRKLISNWLLIIHQIFIDD